MEEWKEYKLREVTTVLGDGIHGTPKYDENGTVYFINGNNLEDGKIIIRDTTKKVSFEEAEKHKKPLTDRTLFVSINGTIGNVARYHGEKCILGKSACYFNVREDFDLNYIYYVIANKSFVKDLERLATGTTIKNVSLETMRNYTFLAPSKDEQTRIASILKSLDDKIECNRRINDNLEQQAQALFKSWFVDFEPFKDKPFVESELGMIPEGWRVGTLDEVGDVIGGSTPSKAKPEYYTENGIAWLTPKDLSVSNAKFTSKGEFDISLEGYNSCSTKLMPKGTVLFSSRAPIGYISIAKNDICTNQGFKSVVPGYAGTAFLYCFLKSATPDIENKATGSTFKEASGSLMKSLQLVIAPKSILDSFEERLKPIFDEQECVENESRRLDELRDTLLPKLMSGDLQISDIDL